ncbi:MAG: formyltetrahydrofolate deformylase [Pseudomonadota bacterium]
MSLDVQPDEFILCCSCPAGSGIVAAITNFLAERGAYLSELAHFDEVSSQQLFLRTRFLIESGDTTLASLQDAFPSVAERFDMQWTIHAAQAPTRTLIMVSQYDHCLDDLLFRLRKGELNMDITAVVSNHLTLRPMVEREGIRFVHLPITKENKPQQEQTLIDIVEETQTDLVVLARYMQILTDDLCSRWPGRVINIHHSFLPGFKGAKPYHQAHARGVKLIGATAHYVTADLDEGPIIEQSVQSVDHSYTPEMLVATGRDSETLALARAVKLHTEHRVFLHENKTIIFR